MKNRDSGQDPQLGSRKYQAPKLSVYGGVAVLTTGGTGKAAENSQSMGAGIKP